MRRFFGRIENDFAYIEGEEFLHLKTVLRMKEGDELIVLNATKTEYISKILEIKKSYAVAQVLSTKICEGLPKKNITMFQAFAKREKLELIVQKAVELGIKKFIPFNSEYCVAKDAVNKKDRLEKIVLSACKQCECSEPMKIEKSLSFSDMLKCASKADIILFANEREGETFDFSSLKDNNNIAIIVGPEGGFSKEEKQKILDVGAKSVSLGKRILRSETASIVLMGIVSTLSGN